MSLILTRMAGRQNLQSTLAGSRYRLLEASFFQALLHVTGLKRINHFVQLAFHEKVEVEQSHADSMIGNPILREIVGSDFFFAATRAN
jgi:hypothetical protein